MAKQKSPGKSLVAIIPEFKLGGEIDKEDVVAITVAAYEHKLMSEEKTLKAVLNSLNKELRLCEKGKEEAIKINVAKHQALAKYKAASTAVVKAGFGTLQVLATSQGVREDNGRFIHIVSVTMNETMSTGRGGHHQQNVMHMSVNLSEPAAHKAFRIREAVLKEKHNDLTDEILEVKRNLADLARKEREARAKLAVVALESTNEGRALLDRLGIEPGNRLLRAKAGKVK